MPVKPQSLVAPFGKEVAKAKQAAWAKYLRTDVTLTNSIGMKLTLIPAGEFLMGSEKSEWEFIKLSPAEVSKLMNSKEEIDKLKLAKAVILFSEHPQHRIKITKPLHIGVFEVTVGQFRQFVNATDYKTEVEKDGEGLIGWNETTKKIEGPDPKYNWKNAVPGQTDEHPVANVSWKDAVAFCKWLSRREGKIYRLPTEAEWEYACRGGTTSLYQTGDLPNGLKAVGNIADQSAKDKVSADSDHFLSVRDGYVYSAPVGRYRSNSFGLYDMHGNVIEWCQDWYDINYYEKSTTADPSGPSSGTSRVVRGGSWGHNVIECRSAARNLRPPDTSHIFLGFRVVCE